VRIRVTQLPLLLGVDWYVGNAKKNRFLMIDKLGVKAVIL
jgi:hypothetical protein